MATDLGVGPAGDGSVKAPAGAQGGGPVQASAGAVSTPAVADGPVEAPAAKDDGVADGPVEAATGPTGQPTSGRLRPRPRTLPPVAALHGLALAVVVGAAGSPGWRVGRVAVVLVGTAVVTWLLARGDHRVARGLAALCCGVVGTAVGAGLGVPHAVAGGPVALTGGGLACLATGLVLLVGGVALLVRATPGWWRLLAVPLVYLLAQLLLLPAGAAVFVTNRAPTALRAATPAEFGQAYQDVSFRAEDGVELSGWYLPGRNRAAVLVLHGAGSTRSDTLDHGVLLARYGYAVLMLDTRGHGRSGGTAMDWGWYGELDVRAAVSYLGNRPGVEPGRIGVLGLSMGGEQAITAAAADPRIKAVVAEGVGVRTLADMAWLPRDAQGWIQRAEGALMYPLADLLSGAEPPVAMRTAMAATAPRPVLLIAGAGESAANRYYRAAAPGSVRLWELPDTPHTRGLDRHPDQWRERVTRLFDDALLG